MVLVLISMGAQAINHRHQKRKASRQSSRSLSPEEAEQATSQPQSRKQPQIPNLTPTIQRTRNPAKRLFSKSCHNNNNNNSTNRKSIIGALCTTTTTATSIITPFTIQNITTTTSPDQEYNPMHEIPHHEIQTPQHASSDYSNTTTLSPYSSAAPSISSNYLTNNTNDNMPFSPDDIGRNISRRQTPVRFELEVEETPVSELQGDSVGGGCGAADWALASASPRQQQHICAWSPDYGTGYLWAGNEGQSWREDGEAGVERWDRFAKGEIVQECVVRPLVPRRSSARMWTPSDQRRMAELEG